MRHAAWHMAEAANQLWDQGKRWQANFCTDMLNLAEFKGLVRPEVATLPTIIYFHENQFAYPNQVEQDRDLHFSITNFSSALAADSVWFNSNFNRDSMVQELDKLCDHWPDYPPRSQLDQVIARSQIIYPGIETPAVVREKSPPTQSIHLVWAARWEHDKGPEDLLSLLRQLVEQQVDFRISVIGQSFRDVPSAFDQIKNEFSNHLVHWGFQPSRENYWNVLASADLFVSTAKHEFFGLAACEAISAGLFPILPNKLAYPELLNELPADAHKIFLYDQISDAVDQIRNAIDHWDQFISHDLAKKFQSRFGECQQAMQMDQWLNGLISGAEQKQEK